MKKASNFASSSFFMKYLMCPKLKLASGKEPGYRHAPVCRLTGLINAVRCKVLGFEALLIDARARLSSWTRLPFSIGDSERSRLRPIVLVARYGFPLEKLEQ